MVIPVPLEVLHAQRCGHDKIRSSLHRRAITRSSLLSQASSSHRRRHFDAARKVLEIKKAETVDPAVTQQQKHFLFLAKIASTLLMNGLETVIPNDASPEFYTIGQPELSDYLEDEQLVKILSKKW